MEIEWALSIRMAAVRMDHLSLLASLLLLLLLLLILLLLLFLFHILTALLSYFGTFVATHSFVTVHAFATLGSLAIKFFVVLAIESFLSAIMSSVSLQLEWLRLRRCTHW